MRTRNDKGEGEGKVLLFVFLLFFLFVADFRDKLLYYLGIVLGAIGAAIAWLFSGLWTIFAEIFHGLVGVGAAVLGFLGGVIVGLGRVVVGFLFLVVQVVGFVITLWLRVIVPSGFTSWGWQIFWLAVLHVLFLSGVFLYFKVRDCDWSIEFEEAGLLNRLWIRYCKWRGYSDEELNSVDFESPHLLTRIVSGFMEWLDDELGDCLAGVVFFSFTLVLLQLAILIGWSWVSPGFGQIPGYFWEPCNQLALEKVRLERLQVALQDQDKEVTETLGFFTQQEQALVKRGQDLREECGVTSFAQHSRCPGFDISLQELCKVVRYRLELERLQSYLQGSVTEVGYLIRDLDYDLHLAQALTGPQVKELIRHIRQTITTRQPQRIPAIDETKLPPCSIQEAWGLLQ